MLHAIPIMFEELPDLKMLMERRIAFENAETEPKTLLDSDLFMKLFGQDWRHEAEGLIDKCKVKLRHLPSFVWATTWVNGSAMSPNQYLLKKTVKLIRKKPLSLVLGPLKKPYEVVNVYVNTTNYMYVHMHA